MPTPRVYTTFAVLQTIDMILGDTAALWEDGEAARLLLRPLGVFKPAVLGLLHRDPVQRSTMQKFLQASRKCLANTSITNSTVT